MGKTVRESDDNWGRCWKLYSARTCALLMRFKRTAGCLFWMSCQQRRGKQLYKTPDPHSSPTESFLPLIGVQDCPLTPVTPPTIGPFHFATMAARAVLFEALKSHPTRLPQDNTPPSWVLSSPHLPNDRFHPPWPDPQKGLRLQAQPTAFLPADPLCQRTHLLLTNTPTHFHTLPPRHKLRVFRKLLRLHFGRPLHWLPQVWKEKMNCGLKRKAN